MSDGQELEHFDEIVSEFVAETRELLEQLDEDLVQLEAEKENPELIQETFRILHTVKGTSGFLNFDRMRLLAHRLEDLLGQLRDGKRKVDEEVMDVLLAGSDRLKELLEKIKEEKTDEGIDVEDLVTSVQNMLEMPEEAAPSEVAVEDTGPVEVDPELFKDFLIESQELLEGLEEHLVELEAKPDDPELLNEIFRAFHTIKGTAGFLGFSRTSELAHRAEEVLDRLKKGQMSVNQDVMDALLAVLDIMKGLLEDIKESQAEKTDIGPAMAMLEALLKGEATPVEVPGKAPKTVQQVEAKAVARAMGGAAETIRVDVRRLDQLMNLVGELVLSRNRLLQLNGEIGTMHKGERIAEELDLATSQLDLLTSELQEMVMKTRMVPVGRVFNKFPRLVRDLCRASGKEVRLVIEGEDTEVDKTVIEEIGDPLVHLIRNAVDHGIELPEERERLGKPREGLIRLYAAQEGDRIVIGVEDDGRGMDAEKIKRKAIERGLLSPDEADRMDDRTAWNLVFLPGFSTADKVTDVSGRGVGMDVVRTNINKLNGNISIDSTPGKGTKVEIRLPLTLAIIQGLVVRVGRELYVVPLSSVVETVRVEPGDVYTIQQREVIRLRDVVLPLVRLDRLFQVPGDGKGDREYVVVIGTEDRRVGLVVDDLVGQEEVVIKSLGKLLQDTPAIAGATIRGDGRVCLITDVNEMIALAWDEIR
ncbi:MAG: chemotaxis protein CheA [Candidatus Latescibacterota bacterium]|nr:MAG: chemotaxis protein CheA [Candidatus Latescibacterota bacterium]